MSGRRDPNGVVLAVGSNRELDDVSGRALPRVGDVFVGGVVLLSIRALVLVHLIHGLD